MNQTRRGFMLIEMLAAIIVLTAFALVVSRLFSWSMRVIREAPAAQETIHQRQWMLERLRRDAWSADQVRVESLCDIVITSQNSPGIRWQIRGDGSVARCVEGVAKETVWTPGPGRLAFEPHDAGVLLVVDGAPMALPSQVILLRRIHP